MRRPRGEPAAFSKPLADQIESKLMAVIRIPKEDRVLRDREDIVAFLAERDITYESWKPSRS